MPGHNKQYRRAQQPVAPFMQKAHFYQQQDNPQTEKDHWNQAMMVFNQSMIERKNAYTKGNTNHKVFKMKVFDNIYPKQRQTAQKKREYGTVNGTSHRSSNPQRIPIDFKTHLPAKVQQCNHVAK